MFTKPIKKKHGPEYHIQRKIIRKLELLGWYVKNTHGNMFQAGFPDLYATHKIHGVRWIEVKVKMGSSFTKAQKECFPLFAANGTKIWVLVSDHDSEIKKLFYRDASGELIDNWYWYV